MQRGYLIFNDDTTTDGGETRPLRSDKDFGVYITGTGSYNAPSRDVTYIAIPGRSQDIIHDNGRYNNITITYPCFIYSATQADFNAKIQAFRNYIKKFIGWVKLQDSYHPDEFRMVSTDAEFDVEVTPDHRAGEFQLTLTAQPFRYLTSGETVVTVNAIVYYGQFPITTTIQNDYDFPAEADFYFRRNGQGLAGKIEIGNALGQTTIEFGAMPAGAKQYAKFDAKTGLFLYATDNDATPGYLDKEYSIIADDVTMTTTDGRYLPSVLAPGENYCVVSATAGTSTCYLDFISYIPHWRIL